MVVALLLLIVAILLFGPKAIRSFLAVVLFLIVLFLLMGAISYDLDENQTPMVPMSLIALGIMAFVGWLWADRRRRQQAAERAASLAQNAYQEADRQRRFDAMQAKSDGFWKKP